MRAIDADELKENLKKWFPKFTLDGIEAKTLFNQILHDIDNAPTVEPKKEIIPVCKVIFDKEQLQEMVDKRIAEMVERPQDEWVRKEDIIDYIATQYSEHNELVPIWLNIGDLKGGTPNG